jgi:hypothetical protein
LPVIGPDRCSPWSRDLNRDWIPHGLGGI